MKSNNHIVVRVKANQPRLLKIARRIAGENSQIPSLRTFEKRHGRIELRETRVVETDPDAFGNEWHGLIQTVVEVFRRTTWKHRGEWRQREETALYLASCSLTQEKAAAVIREHWGIENRNHHVRDVTMREDASRIRTKPGIFARVRSFALNIMRKNGIDNISQGFFENALSLTKVLGMEGVE